MYVQANTKPTFGSRAQALSPFRTPLSGFGSPWFEGPYAMYAPQEYSRTRAIGRRALANYMPASPTTRLWAQGAVTYRINPQTGRYQFNATDILPRGLYQQTAFQAPPRPALSSLGVPMGTRGTTLISVGGRQMVMPTTPGGVRRGPTSNDPMVKLRAAFAGMFSGCSCGSCGMSGLGQNAGDSCSQDTDCNSGLTCNNGTCGAQLLEAGDPCDQNTDCSGALLCCGGKGDGSVAGTCGTTCPATSSSTSPGNSALQLISSILGVRPTTTTSPAVQQNPLGNFLTGSTNILGANIPNVVLGGGALMLVIAAAASGGGKRR